MYGALRDSIRRHARIARTAVWPLVKDWITYQSRCQFLLQEGRVAAEGLFYCGEDVPNFGDGSDGLSTKPYSLPYGYNWDVCGRDAFLKLRVDSDRRIVVPGGVAYDMLILPDSEQMSVEVLQKTEALLKADFREAIVELPQWVKEGKRSPTGRHTFTTWKLWNKDDKLLPSGLLGPVVLRTVLLVM